MRRYIFYTTDDLIHNQSGGIKRLLELIYGLLEMGDIVHLYIPDHAELQDHPNLLRHPVKRRVSRFLPNGLINFISNYRQLRRINKTGEARVVVMSVPYAIQLVLAGISHISLIIREDFIDYRRLRLESAGLPGFFIKFSLLIWQKVEGYTLKKADRIIVQCEYDKSKLTDRHPRLQEKLNSRISIVNNNVNPSWIRNMKELKHHWKYEEKNNYTLAYIGNINNLRKGLHLLLAAVKKLLDASYPVELHVMGEGKLKNLYQKQYQDYSAVVFHGHVDNPIEKLLNMDLLVVPSLSDSFPNSVMEGLYLEMPVLGARTGGIPEMLKYDELLFEPDGEAIFERISAVIDQDEWQYLRRLSRRRKEALSFDWPAEMRKVI